MTAAKYGRYTVLTMLVEFGADVHAVNAFGNH